MTIYQDKTTGHRVEVTDSTAELVAFCPQGGGFLRWMPAEEFAKDFEVAPEPIFQPAAVTADFLPDGVSLPCYSNDERWNGWGMPYLTRASVDKLIQLADDLGVAWASDGVGVIVRDEDAEGGSYTVSPHAMPDGVLAWPVGAGSWCWNGCIVVPTIDELGQE